jgi:hypothetical protein
MSSHAHATVLAMVPGETCLRRIQSRKEPFAWHETICFNSLSSLLLIENRHGDAS